MYLMKLLKVLTNNGIYKTIEDLIRNTKVFLLGNKNFLLFSILKVATQVISLLINIIIVRKLTIDQYGYYSVILMLIGLIMSFGFSWSTTSIVYFGSKEKETRGKMTYTVTSRNIIFGMTIIVLALVFAVFGDIVKDYVGMDVNLLIFVSSIMQALLGIFEYYFLAVKKQIISALLILSSRMLFFITILIFDASIKRILLLEIIGILLSFVLLTKVEKIDFLRAEFNKNHFIEFFRFSVWQLFGFSGVYLINFGDNWVIKHFMTLADLGIYNAPYKLFTGISQLAYVIVSYYSSRIAIYTSQKNIYKLKKFYYYDRFILLGISILLHIILIAFSEKIILLLFGSTYNGSSIVLKILLVGSVFRYIEVFNVIFFNTNSRFKFLQYTNILQAVINFVFSFILVQLYGIIGAAIATAMAISLKTIISVINCEKDIMRLCNVGRNNSEISKEN